EHLARMANLTRAAVDGAPDDGVRAAVVLGAGACTEIPLRWLCEHCARVTLVDVDERAMAYARDELPASLRSRLRIVTADLTGGVSQALERELVAQPWTELARLTGASGRAPLDAATTCLERCEIPTPPAIPALPPHEFSVVISDRALTQLFGLPLLDALDTLMLYAPDAADSRDSYPRYASAARDFRRRIALAHLALMTSLAAPGASALLLTDVRGYLLAPEEGPHAGEIETLDVLPAASLDLNADVGAYFADVTVSPAWRWTLSLARDGTPGRAYDVVGVSGRAR
ncbi:MAG TPA: hypothetical protein VJN88_13565, partial [Ktedonobacterales bacterium]|nr:hypothetical protein [Ktedonobacterales bacterium]